MFMLENTATLPREGIFVLIGVAVLVVIYILLRFLKSKRTETVIVPEENIDDEIAAITAAVAMILEEEAEREERKPTPFRVVSFKRTNKRRIGD